ncbi:hypothetical protein PC129_g8222 [Phytophthora cactorum]|uniref:Necrosis inducing protein n=1 Tax=Phytophthora cactorum TaxID=29920 RepID=A0A8T1IA70_9STRA|nr:hypothetical protein PC112_g8558 [Phytophthora cactorum]KAG2830417.1 hypothetical protein PC111_g7396 [Phytophthora cactorum]KAG2921452.1 hypothetical protein PC114_g5683 [Phytophthora cactorum]KAG2926838.1 hypothetical protein PC115_g7790 [Phytophthora cactorum]KAG2942650.1 hypothetical protein PC117_g9705 [Phytophthora cactorum]
MPTSTLPCGIIAELFVAVVALKSADDADVGIGDGVFDELDVATPAHGLARKFASCVSPGQCQRSPLKPRQASTRYYDATISGYHRGKSFGNVPDRLPPLHFGLNPSNVEPPSRYPVQTLLHSRDYGQ